MGLKKVKEEILRKAEAEASLIIREGEKEVDEVMAETQKQISDEKKNSELRIKNLLENIEKKERASTQFEVKKRMFQKKKEFMDKIFEKTENKLTNLNDKERGDFLKKLLGKAKKEIDVKRIYTKKSDKRFFKGAETEEMEMKGGLIAETADRSVRIDYRFETMLEDIKEKNLPEIAKILFG
ncbi:hypothetical protein HQ529_03050 [Candidatus Woesearchaeota archaeon]|nr:hypothetical protein [Candidatus Woesearchaeota archaeon]